MASTANVLRPDTPAEQSFGPSPHLFGRVPNENYRKAVSKVVGEIQAERDLNDEQLAEILGCSEGTVANARNQRGNLDPVTMLNLGAMFGGERRLKPILALINGSPDQPLTKNDHIRKAREHLNIAEGMDRA